MDLQINGYNNRFKLKGSLNKLSVKTFNDHFTNIFDKLDDMLLDIESLEHIDRDGVMALARLHNESIVKSKRLSIIGLGCKELYQHFKAAEPSETLPSDDIVAA